MTTYDAWNLVTLQISEIEVHNFVSIYRWHGYIDIYNISAKKKHTDGDIFNINIYISLTIWTM